MKIDIFLHVIILISASIILIICIAVDIYRKESKRLKSEPTPLKV